MRSQELLGPRATDAMTVREHHSHGESYHPPAAPDVVCFPSTAEEVVEIVRISARFGVPIVPFGAGTSLEGHVQALRGGITIDLRDLNRVVRIIVDDLALRKAGVSGLHEQGLTTPSDVSSRSSAEHYRGMTATRASGYNRRSLRDVRGTCLAAAGLATEPRPEVQRARK